MEEKNLEKKEKPKKIGIKTLGVILIVFGILFAVQVIFKIDILNYIAFAWPILLVALGLEILITSRKSEIKISIGSLIIMGFIIFFSFCMGAANILINNIIYSDEILEEISDTNRMYYLDDEAEKISVLNYSTCTINLKIVEDPHTDSKIYTNIKYDVKYKNNIANFINYMRLEEYPLYRIEDGIEIVDMPANVKSVDITVFTDNKDKVETYGNVEILN